MNAKVKLAVTSIITAMAMAVSAQAAENIIKTKAIGYSIISKPIVTTTIYRTNKQGICALDMYYANNSTKHITKYIECTKLQDFLQQIDTIAINYKE